MYRIGFLIFAALVWFQTGHTAEYDSEHKKIVILLSNPRNITTAFERSFIEREDFIVMHEPWCYLYWYNNPNALWECEVPEWVSSNNSYTKMRDYIISEAKRKYVFAKDFTFILKNQLRNDTEFLLDDNVEVTFLIRHPAKAIRSAYDKQNDFPREFFDYEELYLTFEKVHELKNKPPIVIESDELLLYPEETLRKYCKQLNIPFSEAMLSWSPGIPEQWEASQSWHTNAANSHGFLQDTRQVETAFDDLPQEIEAELAELCKKQLPYYEKLKDYVNLSR